MRPASHRAPFAQTHKREGVLTPVKRDAGFRVCLVGLCRQSRCNQRRHGLDRRIRFDADLAGSVGVESPAPDRQSSSKKARQHHENGERQQQLYQGQSLLTVAPTSSTRPSSVTSGHDHGLATGASFTAASLATVPSPARTATSTPERGHGIGCARLGLAACGSRIRRNRLDGTNSLPPSVHISRYGLRVAPAPALRLLLQLPGATAPPATRCGLSAFARRNASQSQLRQRYRRRPSARIMKAIRISSRAKPCSPRRLPATCGWLERSRGHRLELRFAGQPVDGDARRPAVKRERNLATRRLTVRKEPNTAPTFAARSASATVIATVIPFGSECMDRARPNCISVGIDTEYGFGIARHCLRPRQLQGRADRSRRDGNSGCRRLRPCIEYDRRAQAL